MANTYGFAKRWDCPAFLADLTIREWAGEECPPISLSFNYSGAIHEALIATFKERMTELLDDMLNASRKAEDCES